MLCAEHTIGSEFILDKVTGLTWNLVWVHLEIVLVLVQDRCTVCAKHTIGLKIILDAPDGTPRWEAQVEDQFSLFGDSANLDAI
jgi:hypothetical protein